MTAAALVAVESVSEDVFPLFADVHDAARAIIANAARIFFEFIVITILMFSFSQILAKLVIIFDKVWSGMAK